MKPFPILLYAITPLARAAVFAPSPVKEADSLITPPPPYPAGDALRAGGLPGMSPLRRGPLYDEDDAANPVEKRQQVLQTTCALIGGNPNLPLGCSGGATCATLTQGDWHGFACCIPDQQCLVETSCAPFISYASCSADYYGCAANPYVIKCGGTYPLCAAVTIQVSGQAFTRTTCALPGYGYTVSATWVAGQGGAATATAGAQKSQAAQTQGGTTNQGLGGDGAVINGNGNVVNYNRSAAGRAMGSPLALGVVLRVVVGAVVVPLVVW